MRHLLVATLAAALILSVAAPAVSAAKPVVEPAAIGLNETGPFAIGDPVTFTTSTGRLAGYEYPLVYLDCRQDGVTVYGQLDFPDTIFILGAGSSPWLALGGPATCTGYLYAYGHRFANQTIRLLAQTVPFAAG